MAQKGMDFALKKTLLKEDAKLMSCQRGSNLRQGKPLRG